MSSSGTRWLCKSLGVKPPRRRHEIQNRRDPIEGSGTSTATATTANTNLEVDQSLQDHTELRLPVEPKYGISIHFGKSETMVSLNYRNSKGVTTTKTIGPYRNFKTFCRESQMNTEALLDWRPKGCRLPCPKRGDQCMVTVNRWNILDGAESHFGHGSNAVSELLLNQNDYFYSEIVDGMFKSIVSDIQKELPEGVDIQDATVAIAVPAMTHPDCRENLKRALEVTGLKNIVFIHMTTAITLSCKSGAPSSGHGAVMIYVRSRLIEVAFAEIVGGGKLNIINMVCRNHHEVPEVGRTQRGKLTRLTIEATEGLLLRNLINPRDVTVGYLVVDNNDGGIGWLFGSLKARFKFQKWVKLPPATGILAGLNAVSVAETPEQDKLTEGESNCKVILSVDWQRPLFDLNFEDDFSDMHF